MNRIGFLLLLLFLVSCNQSKTVNETVEQTSMAPVTSPVEQKVSFETGVVIPSVALRNNPSQTFALYLPKIFNDSVNPHCIIFFDPHGDGTFPLEKYKSLAEKNDFILIGSNFSRNENLFESNLQNAGHLVSEVVSRFHPYNGQVTLCGFSGGAKVALIEGPWLSPVNQIIYCGAVTELQKGNHPFKLFGIAGNRDMNYTDLISFYRTNKNHELIEWNGKHEWPDEKVFANAFQFALTDVIGYRKELQSKISDAEVAEEQNYKLKLQHAFQTQDLNWWKQEIASLNSKKKTAPMYERLLGFISLACYSYSNQTLQQNNLQSAEKILAIYQLADPGNKDCETFKVELQKRKTGTHQ